MEQEIIGLKGLNSANRTSGKAIAKIIERLNEIEAIFQGMDAADYEALKDTAEMKAAVENLFTTKQDKLVSGTNIKTINGKSILGIGNLGIHDVFVAEYGVTPYADVLAAYTEGKTIIVKNEDFTTQNNPCNYYQLVFAYYIPDGNYGHTYVFTFISYDDAAATVGGIKRFYLQPYEDSTYSTIERLALEDSSNKTNDIANNDTDTTKYPSCKGVADYVSDIVGNINTILETI